MENKKTKVIVGLSGGVDSAVALINLINEIDKIKSVNNFIIDLSYIDDIGIIDKYINNNKMDNTYIGFFDKKTVYKLKNE